MSQSEGRHPLSAAQAGMWFAQQIDPANPIFAGGQYVEISGPIEPDLLVQALVGTMRQSESFLVRFDDDGDGPYQQRHEHPMEIVRLDFTDRPPAQAQAAAEEWMRQEMARPLELRREPFFSSAVIAVEPERHLWFQRAHHIVCDGYASALVAGVVAEAYNRLLAGEPVGSAGFASLAEVLADDADYRGSDQFELDRQFWLDRFAERPDVLGLAEGTAQPAHTFHRQTAEMPAEVKEAADRLGRAARTSHSVVICAAMALYLARRHGSRQVVVGLPVAARFGPAMKRTPSMMANVLPLLITVDPYCSARDFVRLVADEIRLALKHQRFRFEDLRRELRLHDGQRLYGPSVDVLRFQLDLNFGGAQASVHILSNGPVEDLNLAVYTGSSIPGLRLCVDANPRLYSAEEAAAHRDRFAAMLTALAQAEPERLIGSLPLPGDAMLTGPERAEIGPRWIERFERQAAERPAAVALRWHGTELSYRELDRRAAELAGLLVERGAGTGTIVAVALPRTPELVVGLLAVAKAGAAHLPLDLNFPAERLELMLSEADPVLVLTTSALTGRLPVAGSARQLLLDRLPAGSRPADPVPGRHPDELAYVIYTSGSTGRPKGVQITHRGLADLLDWSGGEFASSPDRPMLAATSLSFDPSVLELLTPLTTGGCLELLAGPLAVADGSPTGSFLGTVPSVFAGLAADHDLRLDVDTVAVTGEPLTPAVAAAIRQAAPGARIANLYGPTEVSVYASAGLAEDGCPGVGRPLPNTGLYVLDSCLRPVEVGVAGELYVAGPGLARGYLHQPRITADRFVANPFGRPGERMYRTGDLVRVGAQGELSYLGRTDFQVKVRGNRIELGEIEAALLGLAGVRAAAVAAADGQRLVGYLVGDALEPDKITRELAGRLPDYMVPTALMVLPELPRTPSGKLDRRALPSPDRAVVPAGRPPRTPDEAAVCELLADLLGLPAVSIDDNFFDLGGNSLLASRLTARIRTRLGREVDLRSVFDQPTVARLMDGLAAQPDQPVRPRPTLQARAR